MSLNYLMVKHKNSLLELLQKYEEMFDGTYGKYTASHYTVELKEDEEPFPIPTVHKSTLKKEVDRLIS